MEVRRYGCLAVVTACPLAARIRCIFLVARPPVSILFSTSTADLQLEAIDALSHRRLVLSATVGDLLEPRARLAHSDIPGHERLSSNVVALDGGHGVSGAFQSPVGQSTANHGSGTSLSGLELASRSGRTMLENGAWRLVWPIMALVSCSSKSSAPSDASSCGHDLFASVSRIIFSFLSIFLLFFS